jgi:glucose-1-phosphatase
MEISHIKAVIWDMGGVILRTHGQEPRLKLADEYHIAVDELCNWVFNSLTAEQAMVGTISGKRHWQAVAKALGVSKNRLAEFEERFWAGDKVDRQLIDFIQKLNKDYKTGLLSNAWSGARQSLSRKNACEQVFQYTMFSYEVKLRKPDARIYEQILTLMQTQANEAIFVDDMSENVEGAKAIGIHAIKFESTDQTIVDVNTLLDLLS